MNPFIRNLAASVCLMVAATPTWATCGGGGGGGRGGVAQGGPGPGDEQQAPVRAPWVIAKAGAALPAGDLVLLWFPASVDEFQKSDLHFSRTLSSLSGQCLGLAVVPPELKDINARYTITDANVPVAVLITADGSEIARFEGKGTALKDKDVSRLAQDEMDKRQDAVKAKLKDADAKKKAGDAEGAKALYQEVWAARCMFAPEAKKAAKGLKALGVEVDEKEMAALYDGPYPVLTASMNARIQDLLKRGVAAEDALDLKLAQRLYEKAVAADPGDAAALSYLAEFHRHHTGNWDLAKKLFHQLLAMPADNVSRAVALHGLGKMTIHGGQFKAGLALMEQSAQVWPLALTYRNMAVYWNSENDPARAYENVQKALALDPQDPYNLVFAATYFTYTGHRDEAVALVKQHENMLPASYNLAAIHALLGNRDEALRLLKRHFWEYEQTDAVREKEMWEARVDIVFASLQHDPEFVALTSLAVDETRNTMSP